MKRIFIGGLGRSGTTIALNALYRHGSVFAVPVETKFLVEEDGFSDLIDALTGRFSIAGASTAVQRFETLMRRQVTGIDDSKFRQQHMLPHAVFKQYETALDGFISVVHRRRYFSRREPLLAALRHFVAQTFDAEATRSGRDIWAEKTPSNLWRLPFLRELWPDCYFVHALRDPRAVLLSLVRLGWLPDDFLPALTIFEGYLAALLEVRRQHLSDPRFVEVRLEDLIHDTRGTLDQMRIALGIEPFDDEPVQAVAATMDTYYATRVPGDGRFTPQDQDLMVELLRPAAVELGYPSEWQMAAQG